MKIKNETIEQFIIFFFHRVKEFVVFNIIVIYKCHRNDKYQL